jgi:hypothetical protein
MIADIFDQDRKCKLTNSNKMQKEVTGKLSYSEMILSFKPTGSSYLYHAITDLGTYPISSIDAEKIISRGSTIPRDRVLYCTVTRC